MSDAPDAIGARFTGGPLDGRTLQMPRWLLEEELHIAAWQLDVLLSGSGHEAAVYHREEDFAIHHDDADGLYVRYEHGPLTYGLEQTVTRDGDITRITLARIPGRLVPCITYGPATAVPFPEPVTVEAGERVVVDMTWLSDAERADTAVPVLMEQAATLRSAATGPSIRRGHTQLVLYDVSEPDLLPDLFLGRL